MKMNKSLIVVIGVLALVASFAIGLCFGKKNPASTMVVTDNQQVVTETRAKTGSAVLYGKIETLKTKGSSYEASFRLVEWVGGDDNEEQAALEAGQCSLEKIENDECLPNGFFIRDTQKKMTLSTSADVRIRVLSPGTTGEVKTDADGNTILREVTSAELTKMLGDARFKTIPFIIMTTKGVITEIQEQYVP